MIGNARRAAQNRDSPSIPARRAGPSNEDVPHPMNRLRRHTRKACLLGTIVVAVLAGCAAPAPAPPPAVVAPAPEPVVAAPAPVPPPPPELTAAQAKAQAQKLALEAVDLLQNGDEPAAHAVIDRALAADATNDLAKKLLDQIRADPQKELGSAHFRYTVQRDDSLSKLAQQYLGDRFRFYILARYNEMPNPSRLAAGQVIKIPGKGPLAAAAPKPPEPVEAATKPSGAGDAEARARDDVQAALRRSREQEARGDLEGAYATLEESLARHPGNEALSRQRDTVRGSLVRAIDREATQAFQRQNLDLAIAKWDRVLVLEPANRKARLERERALELKKKLTDKFGGK